MYDSFVAIFDFPSRLYRQQQFLLAASLSLITDPLNITSLVKGMVSSIHLTVDQGYL